MGASIRMNKWGDDEYECRSSWSLAHVMKKDAEKHQMSVDYDGPLYVGLAAFVNGRYEYHPLPRITRPSRDPSTRRAEA
ncbi:hypothetical protein F4782DRAFT_503184 [Xylaria castorea]|nr:hypothetical protein F4782DRAFT_503184 [Xylaria castorea]